MSSKKINIVVAGATGYVGLDLIKILSNHPKAKLKYLCAQKNIGKPIQFFDKRIKKKLPNISNLKKVKWEEIDLLFTSLPNGKAQILTKKLWKYKSFMKTYDYILLEKDDMIFKIELKKNGFSSTSISELSKILSYKGDNNKKIEFLSKFLKNSKNYSLNRKTYINLRWIAIIGQLVAINIANEGLKINPKNYFILPKKN